MRNRPLNSDAHLSSQTVRIISSCLEIRVQEIAERLRGTHQITRARQHQLRPEVEDGREKYYHVTAAVPEAPGHY